MISRRSLMVGVAATIACATPALAAIPQQISAPPPTPRGMVAFFVRSETIRPGKDPIYDVVQRIFDGERWLDLDSEAGWTLYINLQYEADPYALE